MKTLTVISSALLALSLSHSALAACNANILKTKPDTIYTDNGDGTVTDTETGLMWDKCTWGLSGSNCSSGTASPSTWVAALAAAQTANAADYLGYSDWRLPNVAELRSLVETACYNPSINEALFPGTQGSAYWSASAYAGSSVIAWVVGFNSGDENYSSRSVSRYARLVRAGQ